MLLDIKNEQLVKDALTSGKCSIKFIKADGSTRIMTATLNPDYINYTRAEKNHEQLAPEEINEISDNSSNVYIQKVFDADINEWRCFVWSRLISVKVI